MQLKESIVASRNGKIKVLNTAGLILFFLGNKLYLDFCSIQMEGFIFVNYSKPIFLVLGTLRSL